MGINRPPRIRYLAGKQLTVRYDNGPAWQYQFDATSKTPDYRTVSADPRFFFAAAASLRAFKCGRS